VHEVLALEKNHSSLESHQNCAAKAPCRDKKKSEVILLVRPPSPTTGTDEPEKNVKILLAHYWPTLVCWCLRFKQVRWKTTKRGTANFADNGWKTEIEPIAIVVRKLAISKPRTRNRLAMLGILPRRVSRLESVMRARGRSFTPAPLAQKTRSYRFDETRDEFASDSKPVHGAPLYLFSAPVAKTEFASWKWQRNAKG
jgi:hypothetical protein